MSPLTRLAALVVTMLPLAATSTVTDMEGRWLRGYVGISLFGRTDTWTRD